MKYEKKGGFQYKKCAICQKYKLCCQHHLERGFKRKDSSIIWVCIFNGQDGCHEYIHKNVEWSYENGYLKNHDFKFYKPNMKIKQDKTCKHSKSFYNAKLGYIQCNFCGKEVDTINFGIKNKSVSSFSPSNDERTTPKMGSEKTDPRIIQAEKLKRKLTELNIKMRKHVKDKEVYLYLEQRSKEIKKEMINLQTTYN